MILIRCILIDIRNSLNRFCKKIHYFSCRRKLDITLNAIKEHNEFLFLQNFKKPDEYINDARKRFYLSMQPTSDAVRAVQDADFKLLKGIIKICDENKLTYFMMGGSAIGAVRHNGFIPWDDDTDIAMPRDDLNKLFKILENNNEYVLKGFAIAFYNWQTFKFSFKNDPLYKMHYIDIFPYDVFKVKPKTALRIAKRYIVLGRLKVYFSLHLRKIFKRNNIKPLMQIYNEPQFNDYFNLLNKVNDKYRIKMQKKEKEKFKPIFVYDTTKVTAFSKITKNYFRVFSYEKIFPLKPIRFRDINVAIPNDCDYFLRYIFGNYWLLPDSFDNHFKI